MLFWFQCQGRLNCHGNASLCSCIYEIWLDIYWSNYFGTDVRASFVFSWQSMLVFFHPIKFAITFTLGNLLSLGRFVYIGLFHFSWDPWCCWLKKKNSFTSNYLFITGVFVPQGFTMLSRFSHICASLLRILLNFHDSYSPPSRFISRSFSTSSS